MGDINKITKSQFDAAYEKHLPSRWIKFAFKYFSKETEKKDMKISNTIAYILIALFVFGFVGTVFSLSKSILLVTTVSYSIILALLVMYLLSAVILNNRRIVKICKELNISKYQYNTLVEKFYS
jgi:hypothetical protein